MNRKIMVVFIVSLLAFALMGCQNQDQVITEEFNNTEWKDEDLGTVLLFADGGLMVNSGEIRPDMEAEQIENVRYETANYQDIKIILEGESIEIYEDDDLVMEFERISDSEIEDSYGSIFVKTDWN